MKIVVTGGQGQVARDLITTAKHSEHELIALNHRELDITNPEMVSEIFSLHRPDIVINTAAYTAVDKAEKETEKAFAVNHDGAANVAKTCESFNIPLIHLSTDFVFDGQQETSYLESNECHPLNVYGDSKLQGECVVRSHLDHHIILRVSGVYGIHGNNFVKTMLHLGKTREKLSVVGDQSTRPTPAIDIAKTLIVLANKIDGGENHWGTYHYCGDETITWHHFAEKIFEIANELTDLKIKHIEAITTEAYNAPAKRPLHPILNCDKIRKTFGIEQANWQESLPQFIQQVLENA